MGLGCPRRPASCRCACCAARPRTCATRVDEDVVGLAEYITAHGLLQRLIGYVDQAKIATGRDKGAHCIMIVGGGRRFQALRRIENEGLIDGDFPVSVLIRDVTEAVELSLAENLQQRTMSPVDEFLAFKALMNNGTTRPRASPSASGSASGS